MELTKCNKHKHNYQIPKDYLSFRNLLDNPEEYFTELVIHDGWYNLYYLSLNLPETEISDNSRPQLGIQLYLDHDQTHFHFAVHPPHHVRYGQPILEGLKGRFLSVDKVQPGETQTVTYTYELTKTTHRDQCGNDVQLLDACQVHFIEKQIGCKLPWLRGKKTGPAQFENVCSGIKATLKNMTAVIKALNHASLKHFLEDTGCAPSCQMYVPTLAKEQERIGGHLDEIDNGTDKRLLQFMVYSEQTTIPVEEIVLSYDNLDAMADVGGYLGLLLGASCLSMIKNTSERLSKHMKTWGLTA